MPLPSLPSWGPYWATVSFPPCRADPGVQGTEQQRATVERFLPPSLAGFPAHISPHEQTQRGASGSWASEWWKGDSPQGIHVCRHECLCTCVHDCALCICAHTCILATPVSTCVCRGLGAECREAGCKTATLPPREQCCASVHLRPDSSMIDRRAITISTEENTVHTD